MIRLLLPFAAGGLMIGAQFALAQARVAPASRRVVSKKAAVVKRPPPVDPTEGDNVDGEDLTVRRAAGSGARDYARQRGGGPTRTPGAF
ncbi:MAG: hypothetical protein WDO73_03300 [Ignavibacteriota bacterium]